MTGISGGGAASSSGLTFNDMPCMEVRSNFLFINISTTPYGAGNTATFWERFDRIGAYTSNASMTADTYYTLVDVTGAGHLGCIITNCLGTGTATLTTKVTIDGTAIERTIDTHFSNTDRHLVFGAPGRVAKADFNTDTYQRLMRGYGYSPWETHNQYDRDNYHYEAGYQSVLPTDIMMAMGLPTIPFKEGLKVEIKQSATGPNSYYVQRAGVGYIRTD